MSEPALALDDMTSTDLRELADRLLETTRVEYVDEGVLLIMNPLPAQYAKAGVPLYLLVDQDRTAWTLHGLDGKPGYQLLAAGKFGESVPLPAPFGFSVPTTEWPS